MTAQPVPTQQAVGRGAAEAALPVGGVLLLLLAALPIDAARVCGAEAAAFRTLDPPTALAG